MAAFEDTFTEASDTDLGAHTPDVGTGWDLNGGGGGTEVYLIDSGNDVIDAQGGTTTGYYHINPANGSANQFVDFQPAELLNAMNGGREFTGIRLTDTNNFIGWRWAGTGASGNRVTKNDGGTQTDLITDDGTDLHLNWWRLEGDGNTITLYKSTDGGSTFPTTIGTATESFNNTETNTGVAKTDDAGTHPHLTAFKSDILATTLTVNDATHSHTADNTTLSEGLTLSVNEATHSHTADASSFSQTHSLTAQEATHSHSAENATFGDGSVTGTATVQAQAATLSGTGQRVGNVYYVDFASGSDSNDGLSKANAFKTFDKARTTAVANDATLFKRGTSQTSISTAWAIKAGQIFGDYGSGSRPILTTSSNVYYFTATAGETDWKIYNLHMKDGQGPCLRLSSQTGGDIKITNVHLNNNLLAIAAGGDSGFDDRSVRIDACYPDSMVWDTVDITQNTGDDCLTAQGLSNFTLSNSTWSVNDGNDVIQIAGTGMQNIWIHDCTFNKLTATAGKGIALFGSADKENASTTVEDCIFDGGNLDLFFGVNFNNGHSIFRRNEIRNIGGGNSAAALQCVGPSDKNAHSPGMTWTDNYIHDVHYGMRFGVNSGNFIDQDVTMQVYDNTFSNMHTWIRRYSNGNGNYHGAIFRNLVDTASNTSQSFLTGDAVVLENNYYFGVSGETNTGSDPAPDSNGVPTHSDAYGYGPKPAIGGTPTVASRQAGNGQIASGDTEHDITLATPLTATKYGPHRSIAVVTYRVASNDSGASNLSWGLIDNNTLRLYRHNSGVVVDYEYYVVEFANGVVVDRHLMPLANVVSEPVTLAFDAIDEVFTLTSWQSFGTAFGGQEHCLVSLAANGSNGLQEATVAIDSGPDAGHKQRFQAIHHNACSVQRGTSTGMQGTTASTTVTITSVDQSKSFLQFSHRHGEASPVGEIGQMMLSEKFNSNTEIQFDREVTGSEHVIAWEVPEFTDSTSVQAITGSMAAAAGTDSSTITAVTLARTIALMSGICVDGRTDYTADDIAGEARVTLDVTTTTNVDWQRNSTNGTFDGTGYVIEFAGAPASATGTATVQAQAATLSANGAVEVHGSLTATAQTPSLFGTGSVISVDAVLNSLLTEDDKQPIYTVELDIFRVAES